MELKKARKILNNAKIIAKKTWLAEKIIEMTEINTNPKDAWKATYEIANGMYGHHKKATTMKMKKADGTMAKNNMENAKVFEDHFKKLFNNTTGTNYDPEILAELTGIETDPTLDKTPTRAEIKKAIAKIANEKAPGPNGITTEVYKNLQGKLLTNWKISSKNFGTTQTVIQKNGHK